MKYLILNTAYHRLSVGLQNSAQNLYPGIGSKSLATRNTTDKKEEIVTFLSKQNDKQTAGETLQNRLVIVTVI